MSGASVNRRPPDIPCPHCGEDSRVYHITTRNRFKCGQCKRQYSATSTTLHRHKKVDDKTLAVVTALVQNNPKASVAHISRVSGMSYRGAYYLVKRIKEHSI